MITCNKINNNNNLIDYISINDIKLFKNEDLNDILDDNIKDNISKIYIIGYKLYDDEFINIDHNMYVI